MVFLPASFVAVCTTGVLHMIQSTNPISQGVFGMNVSEINPGTFGTLGIYVAIAIPLTIITAWVIIAFQSKYIFPENTGFIKRLGWPVYMTLKMLKKKEGLARARAEEDSIEYSLDSKEAIQSRSFL